MFFLEMQIFVKKLTTLIKLQFKKYFKKNNLYKQFSAFKYSLNIFIAEKYNLNLYVQMILYIHM